MSSFRWTAALSLTVLLTASAQAFDAAQSAKTIAPYIDDNTLVVARVDLTKVKPAEIFAVLKKYVPGRPQDFESSQNELTGFLAGLRAEKVSEAFLVVNTEDIPNGQPAVIVPVGAGGDKNKVASLLFSGKPDGPTARNIGGRNGPFEMAKPLNDVVIGGSPATYERLKTLKSKSRPELAAAFQLVENASVQVALIPSKDHHRVLAEMMPSLPKQLGGVSGKELAGSVKMAALGIHLPPEMKAELVVESMNADSAQALKKVILAGSAMLKNDPAVRGTIADLEKLTELLSPTVKDNRLTMSFDASSKPGQQIIALFGVGVASARKASARAQSSNNLKQFGLAMHNFHDTYKSFPPHASYSKKEKPLLSWRVYVLPFLEGDELFKQFHLDEPWDSEHNKKLIAKMPKVFADPSGQLKKPGMTRFVLPILKNGIFDGKPEGLRIRDITDGTSNTIMTLEVAPEKAVIWTKPDDIEIDLKNPLKGLVAKDGKGFLAGLADGSVRFIAKSVNLKTLSALFTRNGGEVVGEF